MIGSDFRLVDSPAGVPTSSVPLSDVASTFRASRNFALSSRLVDLGISGRIQSLTSMHFLYFAHAHTYLTRNFFTIETSHGLTGT